MSSNVQFSCRLRLVRLKYFFYKDLNSGSTWPTKCIKIDCLSLRRSIAEQRSSKSYYLVT